ncbi:MAG: hypothetical protein AABY00_03820 [Nanoarchaeota archaeon]
MDLVHKIVAATALTAAVTFADVSSFSSPRLPSQPTILFRSSVDLSKYVHLGTYEDHNKNGKLDPGEKAALYPYWERPVLREGVNVEVIIPWSDRPTRVIVKEALARAVLFDYLVVPPKSDTNAFVSFQRPFVAWPFNSREYKKSVLENKEFTINDPPIRVETFWGWEKRYPVRTIPSSELVEGKRMYVIELSQGNQPIGRTSFFVEYNSEPEKKK